MSFGIKELNTQLALISWVYFLVSSIVWAQGPTVQLLKTKLPHLSADSARASAFWALARAYESNQVDSALYYAQQSINLIKNNSNAPLLTDHYYTLGRLYFRKSDFATSLQILSKGRQLAQQDHLTVIQLKIQAMMVLVYSNQGNDRQGLQLALQTLRTYQQQPRLDQRGISLLYTALGLMYEAIHKDRQALFYHKKRVELARKYQDRQDEAKALSNVGQFYLDHHQLGLAYTVTRQSLALARSEGLRNLLTNKPKCLAALPMPANSTLRHCIRISKPWLWPFRWVNRK